MQVRGSQGCSRVCAGGGLLGQRSHSHYPCLWANLCLGSASLLPPEGVDVSSKIHLLMAVGCRARGMAAGTRDGPA